MPNSHSPTDKPAEAIHVLSARHVSKKYKMGEVDVAGVKDITLNITRHELLALAGPSGSGKTTLLNLLGLIDRPSDGEIWIDGVNTAKLSANALSEVRAKKIGYVFQTFNLIPTLTALENVEYPLLLLNISPRGRRNYAKEALEKVGLKDQMNRRPSALSGGQRQRIAIARALVKKPAIILADEPTANLDKATALSVLELMTDLNTKDGITFLFSSHDPLILNRANRVFRLIDGQQDSAMFTEENHAV